MKIRSMFDLCTYNPIIEFVCYKFVEGRIFFLTMYAFIYFIRCRTVALMVLGQFSDICIGPQISENWPRTIRATVP